MAADGLQMGSVRRALPIVLAFVAGAACSWWIIRPAASTVGRVTTVREERLSASDTARADVAAAITRAAGIPPDAATLPKPAPGAGQKRALRRAIDELERNPPVIDGGETDEETRAAVATGVRAALLGEGEQP
jgi:hypothetical protein